MLTSEVSNQLSEHSLEPSCCVCVTIWMEIIRNVEANTLSIITPGCVRVSVSLVPSPTLGRWVWLPAYSKLGQHYVSGPRSGPVM